MIIPLRTDSPLRSTPWMNWAIIAANVIVFLLQRREPSFETSWVLNPREPRLASYLSYLWLHANAAHLVGNMLFLYIFGNNVNDRMGHIGYLGFYLAGGVFAGVGHTITQMAPVVGASGAVAAVTGAYLVLFPRSSITVIYLLFFIGTIEIPSMWFIAFFFIKDVVLNFSAEPTGTAHMAHVSGTLYGLGVCFALLSVQLLPRDQFDVVALVQRWNKRRQYRDMVSRGYDPFGYIPPALTRDGDTTPADPMLQKIQDLRAEISEAVAHHNHPRAALLFLELKRLDPQQVLSRQAQLEVANQLASQQLYHEAADAYEQFIKHYSNFDQIEQVELMLGLIYARYLNAYEPAREYLLRAMARLHGEREVSMARAELARIEALAGPRASK
jgi:membrane associated rhomboid family serine protease